MDVIPYPDGNFRAMPRERSSRSSEMNRHQQMFPNLCSQISVHLRSPGCHTIPVIVQHEHTLPCSAALTQVAPASTACRASYQLLITNRQNVFPVGQRHSRRRRGRSILPLSDFYQSFGKGRSASRRLTCPRAPDLPPWAATTRTCSRSFYGGSNARCADHTPVTGSNK